MTGNGNNPQSSRALHNPAKRRSPLPIAIIAALFVVATFLTWHGTWFGNSLSDEEISRYLSEQDKPQHVLHALSQVEERIEKKDETAKRWYPQVVALADSPVTEIRKTVAWVAGSDNRAEEFHGALLKLLKDEQPVVRRNAAVQLAVFKDGSGRQELRAIFQPYDVSTPVDGTIISALVQGATVKEGSLLARIKHDEKIAELRSPLPGKISNVTASENAIVKAGDKLFSIGPDESFVYEALRALVIVG
ncbi:MAG: biotin/lipoyl-containing protein, partial [Pyrinomonadaceae bacterium]